MGTALALGGLPQDGGTAGCVDVGLVREGFLPLGMGVASAPLDVTACASFSFRGKSVTTSTHRHPHTQSARYARARVTHVTHLWPARVSVALCTVSACE